MALAACRTASQRQLSDGSTKFSSPSSSAQPLSCSFLQSVPSRFVPQHSSQLHACFMKLRLAIAGTATEHLGGLLMLIAEYVMKCKHQPVPGRKMIKCTFQGYATQRLAQLRVFKRQNCLRNITFFFLSHILQW